MQDGEWIGTHGLARLVFLHAMAMLDASLCEKLETNGALFEMDPVG